MAAAPSNVGAHLANLPRHPSVPAGFAEGALAPLRVPERAASRVYWATHDRTEPPPDQVVTMEKKNILLRQFHTREEKRERQKRAERSQSSAAGTTAEERRPKSARREAIPRSMHSG